MIALVNILSADIAANVEEEAFIIQIFGCYEEALLLFDVFDNWP